MIRELRTYDCHPGKMPHLIRRFEEHTRGIFDRLGIRYSDFWISTEDPNQLIYFLFWDDMAEHDKKWAVFLADPEWIKVRDASQVDGTILSKVTSRYYAPIDFTKPMNHTR
jgi:hypothetical protein